MTTRPALLSLLILTLILGACSGDATPATRNTAAISTAGAPSAVIATAPTGSASEPLLEAEPPRANRVELARRLGGVTAPTGSPLPAVSAQPGDRRDFWVVQSEPPRAFRVSATLRAVSAHALFYVQDDARVSDADMTAASEAFETQIYPGVTRLFGEPVPPADADPRITILHLNLPGVGGYFTATDLLPRAVAPISNERRMIYIDLRAGPPGTNGYAAVVAHEFQHLIQQDRNPDSDTWFNEGLSEVANEAVSGGVPLLAYANTPDTDLTDWAVSGSNAAHYDAAHSFLRYLLRRYGGLERARDLVAAGGSGVNAVQKYLRDGGFGVSFDDVFADWLVAGYLDLPGDGRFSNAGAESKVRAISRLTSPDSGSGDVQQFGADYFEIAPHRGDVQFRFQGATAVKQIPNEPASGTGEWWSGRGDSLDTTLTRTLDLRSVTAATLRFKAWYDIEPAYDYAYVTASADGGATWRVLRGTRTTDLDPLSQSYGPGYTGTSGAGDPPIWVDEQIDLTPYAGRSVLLRFEYVTDEAASGAGFAIDDLSVPEIGFFDDAEADSGWQAVGFRRIAAPLPQRFLIQVVTEEAGGWTSRRVDVDATGAAQIRLPASDTRAAIIVAGDTYGTNLAAGYSWSFGPAGN